MNIPETTTGILHALIDELGEVVSTDDAELDSVRSDKSGHRAAGRPIAIVHARTVADVQSTMRIASLFGTPVVTRGAGTGLAGGAIGDTGEIVLSTIQMNRILEVSADEIGRAHV